MWGEGEGVGSGALNTPASTRNNKRVYSGAGGRQRGWFNLITDSGEMTSSG